MYGEGEDEGEGEGEGGGEDIDRTLIVTLALTLFDCRRWWIVTGQRSTSISHQRWCMQRQRWRTTVHAGIVAGLVIHAGIVAGLIFVLASN